MWFNKLTSHCACLDGIEFNQDLINMAKRSRAPALPIYFNYRSALTEVNLML